MEFARKQKTNTLILAVTQRCDNTMIADHVKVKHLGADLMIHFKRYFPCTMLTPSVHQLAAHSWQLFEMTNGKSIATYSEQIYPLLQIRRSFSCSTMLD